MKNKLAILGIVLLVIMAISWTGWRKSHNEATAVAESTTALSVSVAEHGGDTGNSRTRSSRNRTADSGGYKRALLDPEVIIAMDHASRLRLLEEIGALSNADEREKAWAALLHIIAEIDPDQAIALARKLPPGAHKEVAKWVGMPLLRSEPAKAAAFMIEMADPEDLATTYTDIASNWVDLDAKAAGDWLNTLPQGPDLDRAGRAYAIKATEQDPAGAMEWAASIENESLRAESLIVIYQSWKREDPAAADAALNHLGLSMGRLKADLHKPRPKLTNGDDDD